MATKKRIFIEIKANFNIFAPINEGDRGLASPIFVLSEEKSGHVGYDGETD